MKKYIVTRKEIYNQPVLVEAKDAEEALKFVVNGGGIALDDQLEFTHVINSEDWEVYDAPEGL